MGGGAGLDFYSSKFSPDHKWLYYPMMTNEEVLLIKTYDSEMTPFQPTLHSAFDDEHTTSTAGERQSCEARVLVLIPKAPRASKM